MRAGHNTDTLKSDVQKPRQTAPSLFPLPTADAEEHLILIRPNKSWEPPDLREVWSYRELLYFLVWRDLKVRYKQTVLGASWVILQPLLMTLVFTVFLGMIVRVPSHGVPYPIFLYAGLLPWTFFSNAVSSSGHSLVASSHLLTKVYFPRIFIPASQVIVRLFDFLIAFSVLVGLLFYYQIHPTTALLILPILILQLTLLSLGLGTWLAALNIKYRDIGTVLPVMLQLCMFASPIIYPATLVPADWRRAYELNPLVGIIEGFHAALFSLNFNWSSMLMSSLITLLILISAAYTFRRMEDEFADVV